MLFTVLFVTFVYVEAASQPPVVGENTVDLVQPGMILVVR
jgi:hypothetical protein